jgi:hypothetical protein
MDCNHVFDDHRHAKLGAGLDTRARYGCVHARRHGKVDSRQLHALFQHPIRINCTMGGMWVFTLMKRLAPRRTARMSEKWRAGAVLLQRTR